MKKLAVSLLLLMSFRVLAAEPRLGDEAILFHTDVGDMVAALYPDQAPLHTAQILKLVRAGVYTNTQFFRTDKGYVTQIENFNMRSQPLTAEQLKLIEKIPGEFNDIHHRRGILSMARFDDPNSAESSFSFVLGEAPNLDKQYTVFGEVIRGMDVLDEIEKLPPKSVYITSAEVVPRLNLPALVGAHPLGSAYAPNDGNALPATNSTLQFLVMTALALAAIAAFDRFFKNRPQK